MRAISTFAEKDLPLWVGQGMAAWPRFTLTPGAWTRAKADLEKACGIYRQYDVLGLRAEQLAGQRAVGDVLELSSQEPRIPLPGRR